MQTMPKFVQYHHSPPWGNGQNELTELGMAIIHIQYTNNILCTLVGSGDNVHYDHSLRNRALESIECNGNTPFSLSRA